MSFAGVFALFKIITNMFFLLKKENDILFRYKVTFFNNKYDSKVLKPEYDFIY